MRSNSVFVEMGAADSEINKRARSVLKVRTHERAAVVISTEKILYLCFIIY